MKLIIPSPIVTVTWLYNNKEKENLIILDASILKVGTAQKKEESKKTIPNSTFFDLKNVFLNKDGQFPNTIPTQNHFEEEVQKLGINKDSCVVVYDDLGVYSSPRAWWLFKLFGFKNVAVLNGGLPAWVKNYYPIEFLSLKESQQGSFTAIFQKELLCKTDNVLLASNNKQVILDARSKERFYATVPEPRKDLRGGHIPNSKSLPYTELQVDGKMKSKEELQKVFSILNPHNKKVIFSCGSGITACILALANEIIGNTNYSVYDGSWTEWASTLELPVEK